MIFDQSKVSLVKYFVESADTAGLDLPLIETAVASNYGEEPSPSAAQNMLHADLVIALTSFSLSQNRARIECSERARFLSLPQYSEELLSDPMVTINYETFFGSRAGGVIQQARLLPASCRRNSDEVAHRT